MVSTKNSIEKKNLSVNRLSPKEKKQNRFDQKRCEFIADKRLHFPRLYQLEKLIYYQTE